MRIAIIGPAGDIHLQRWGEALHQVGATVLYVGIEPAPSTLKPYFCIGKAVQNPTLWDFLERRSALYTFLKDQKVDVAHPIHLTPSGVWVWSSGFRPYVPFAMGADILEYSPHAPPLRRSWTLQSRKLTPTALFTAALRRRLLPPLLRATLRESLLSFADNYELCFSKKYLEIQKEKIVELPAGIAFPSPEREAIRPYILAPRGATRLYQADIILAGYRLYIEAGGRLPLILLAGSYSPHPTILHQANEIKNRFPDMFFFFKKVLDKTEMSGLWRQTAAFISAPVYDGYSYAVAEGRAYGALPIVNAIPAHLEILTHGYNAWFVEPFTPEALAEALFTVEKLLQSEPFWIPRNARWIARFSNIVENARVFLNLVEEALRKCG